jgi:hypothetical protein
VSTFFKVVHERRNEHKNLRPLSIFGGAPPLFFFAMRVLFDSNEQGTIAGKARLLAGGEVRGEFDLSHIREGLSPRRQPLFRRWKRNSEAMTPNQSTSTLSRSTRRWKNSSALTEF